MANHIPTQRVTDDDIESLDDIINTIRELAHDDNEGEHSNVNDTTMLLNTNTIRCIINKG